MSLRLNLKSSAAMICIAAGLSLFATSCSKSDQEKPSPAPQAQTTPASTTATILRDGVTFTADPNPILTGDPRKAGVTTLSWKAPVAVVQVHVGSPGGTLFAQLGGTGHATTGQWVANGTVFYLQDGTAANPKDSSATMATIAIAVQ